MASNDVIDVTEENFETEVIKTSLSRPVVVDFWAAWCVPCKVLGPLLERLALEAKGAFRLAKLDVDANPNLALKFGVRSIPAVKAFVGGQVVNEFIGALAEPRVREFIRKLAPTEGDLVLEKAASLAQAHQWLSAEKVFRQALEQSPGSPAAILGLAKTILAQGKGDEARQLLQNFPASREYSTAQSLLPLVDAYARLLKSPVPEDDPLAPAYHNAIRLAARGNILAALDGILDVLRQNKQYQNGQARLIFLALLEILGADDPQTREYRNELASVLF